jgi:hypothetical protein
MNARVRTAAVRIGAGLVAVAALTGTLFAQVQRDRQTPARDRAAIAPTGTGAIAGVVVVADPASGAERPQPVRRATVMLASGLTVVPRTAATDDEGRFEFTGLAAGNYTLVTQKPAWVSSVYGARSASDTQGIPIAVVDGQRVDGLRIPLSRGAVVAGTLRYASGVPASNVAVQVLRVSRVDGQRQVTMVAQPGETNDLGAFRVFGLAGGDYVVQARPTQFGLGVASGRVVTEAEVRWGDQKLAQAQGTAEAVEPPPPGQAVTFSMVYFPGTPVVSDATVLTLRMGEERGGVDFTVTPVPTGNVSGTVLTPDGDPAAGATVTLEHDVSDGDVLGRLMGGSRATTGRDGRFTLSGVTPGKYTVTVRGTPRPAPGAPTPPTGGEADLGLAMMAAFAGMGGAENPATLWTTDTVSVNGLDVGPLTFQLRDGLTVEGTVVADTGGPPADASDVRISLARPTGGDPTAAAMSRMFNSSTGALKADGTFAVKGLVPGRYVLTASGKAMRTAVVIPGMPLGKTGWVVKSIRWRELDLADTGIDLRPDVPVTGVVVTLTNRPSELSGTVIDQAGRPTGAFPIVVYSVNRAHWGAGSRRVVQAQPASDGKFSVIGLPAGEYLLAAVTRLEPGDLESPQFLDELVPSAVRLTMGDGEKKTQDVKLAAGG